MEIRQGDAVLFRTGYLRYWGVDAEAAARHKGAGISVDVALALAEAGVSLVGADTETVERDDGDIRWSDRDSGPIIRRVPPHVFLPLTTTFGIPPSPPQPPDASSPFPLLPFTSKSRACRVPHEDYHI